MSQARIKMLSMVLLLMFFLGADQMMPSRSQDLLSLKQSEDQRVEALTRLVEERSDMQGSLLTLAGSNSPETKAAAVFMLGYYRMEQATRSLSDMIDFKADQGTGRNNREPLWGQFPAVEALVRIGKPSTPFMLARLRDDYPVPIRKLAASVLRQVEGEEVARFLLQNEIKNETSDMKTKRLQISLDEFFSN